MPVTPSPTPELIAAADESLLVGVPAIAVSLAITWPISDDEPQWETAARCAVELAAKAHSLDLPATTLLNLNVPNVEPALLRGASSPHRRASATGIARIGASIRAARPCVDSWGSHNADKIEEGSDLAALRDGYASVTPITIDRTDDVTLARSWREAP